MGSRPFADTGLLSQGGEQRPAALIRVADMSSHRVSRGALVPHFNCSDDRLVLDNSSLAPDRRFWEGSEDVVQKDSYLLHCLDEKAVASALRDCQVKLGVVLDELAVGARLGCAPGCAGDALDVSRRSHKRTSARRRWLDLEPVRQGLLDQRTLGTDSGDQLVDRAALVLGRHHKVPSVAPSPALDEAIVNQQSNRLLDSLSGHPKHPRELAFRGQRIAARDQVESDLAAYLLSHVFVSTRLVKSIELDGVTRCHCCNDTGAPEPIQPA